MTSPAMTRPIEAAYHKVLFCTTRSYHQKRGKMISRSRGGSSLSARFCASCSASASSARREGVAEEDGQGTDFGLEHVVRFDMSDFHVCDRVSVGVAGRADEVIFEAVVINENSTLHNTRVVLRQLTTMQAQRRGRRAMEVLKRLARRQLMYHSYAMQVHGYVYLPNNEKPGSFTLVHGYHGSYSLRHWLQLSDWLPTLEATLALDEEWVRRVGDDNIGGSAVTRQLRLTRILMRDLLIGVNYLHSHGLAHTELTLENVHISPVDRHVKVGILGNASDFHDNKLDSTSDVNPERRKLMIAYDMRCFGFIMAKMVLRELMDPEIFLMFKYFLTKGSDPSCLREFLLPILHRNSLSGNTGLQMLDRNWGAGWNLLSLLLATSPSKRISCLHALRHPFLCGPRWRVGQSVDVIRWSLGSTAVRIAEEYIYGKQQRNRVAHFIELMEMLNPHPKLKNWLELLPGRWRLLYSTGRHIGLTLRQANPRVLIGNAYLTFTENSDSDGPSFHLTSNISFKVISTPEWPHDKSGAPGSLHINAKSVRLTPGSTLFYIKDESNGSSNRVNRLSRESIARKLTSKKWKSMGFIKEFPSSLPASKLTIDDIEISMNLESSSSKTSLAQDVLREVRTQIPPEMFDISKLVCGTYIDSRLLILRGVNGSALLLTRSS